MEFRVDNFSRGDVNRLRSGLTENEALSYISEPAVVDGFEASNHAFSATTDGEVISMGGVHQIWQGRALAWMVFSDDISTREFLYVHRFVLNFLENAAEEFPRVELTVVDGFRNGHRWAKMLGFECEGFMCKYGHDGATHWLYARISEADNV